MPPPPPGTAPLPRARQLNPFAAGTVRSTWVLFCLWAAGGVAAQQAATSFTAPDGSRFVLVPDSAVPHVQWAIATWADGGDDPPGLEGLARATMRAAAHGPWSIGSRDVAAERACLEEQDLAWQRLLADPRDASAAQRVRELDQRSQELFDATVFPRMLAAAPCHRVEIVERGPVAVLVLTTMPAAIGEVGRLLVERREQQPLRRLPASWLATFGARAAAHAAERHVAVRAEVLALTMPSHPAARFLQPPVPASPTRRQALATWAQSQRPERTVHVLFGDFDRGSAEATLGATFTATALPSRPGNNPPPPQPQAAVRRSLVSGAARPVVAIGWILPAPIDHRIVAAAAAWLGDGPDGHLAGELRRLGRSPRAVRCLAPWPIAADWPGLFLIEVEDDRADGLADLIASTVQKSSQAPPDAVAVQTTLAAMQRRWREQNPGSRELAITLAVEALQWPAQPIAAHGPTGLDAKAMQEALARIFKSQPVIVEGRP